MKTPHRFLLGAFLSALILGGCKDLFPPDPDDNDPDPAIKTLPGTDWYLVSYEKSTGEVIAVDPPTSGVYSAVTLSFTDKSCGGEGPCNNYGSECTFDPRGAGTIDVNGIFSTNRACDRLQLENLYFTALDNATEYKIDNDGLHMLVQSSATNPVTVLNFAEYKKDPQPDPTNGAIQYRKVTVASDVFELHRINADGSGETTITSWQNFLSSASRNGSTAFLAQPPGASQFSLMMWQSDNPSAAPQTVAAGGDISFFLNSVAVSPDGMKVAVIGYDNKTVPPMNHFNVYIYKLTANGAAIDTCLDAEANSTPVFSPDSKQIAWYGSNNTVRMATIGSNAPDQEIASNAIAFSLPCPGRLEWVAGARAIIYVGAHSSIAKSDETDLWMVPLPGGAPINMTNDPNIDCWPAVSPDGHQIAYVHQADASPFTIYRMKLDAQGNAGTPEPFGPQRMIAVVLHDLFPQWSPDGTQILYTSFLNMNSSNAPGMSGNLERMSVNDHLPVQIAPSAERGFWEY